MKNLIPFGVAYFLLVCASLALGQRPENDANFSISHYTEENGLPQNTVKNISADSEGFIWIVSETGLVRFDGRNFYLFTKSNLPISNNRFSMLQPDISETRGVKRFYAVAENYEFIRIESGKAQVDSEYYNNSILRIPFMRNPRKTSILANGAPNYMREWADPDNYIIPIGSGKGNFFICHHQKIEYYSNWKKNFELPFVNLRYWDCFTIGKNLYHFTGERSLTKITGTGLIKFALTGDILKDKTYSDQKHQPEIYWNNISDQVFVYFNKNLYKIKESPENKLSTVLVLENFDFGERNISSIHFDSQNQRFFLGSVTKGLFILKRKDFITLRTTGSNLDNVFYGQTAYDSNSVLTPRGFLLSRSRHGTATINKEISVISSEKNAADSYGILTDKQGNVWRKSGGIIYCYRIKENKLVRSWNVGTEINHIYEGNDGTIWIGTRESGLFRINLSDPRPEPQLFVKGDLTRISFLLEKNSQTLVVGTDHGVFLLDILSKKTDVIRGTGKLYVRSLYIDASPGKKNQKNIWISTYEDGIFLYGENGLTKFPLDKNKYLSGAHCIFADKNNFFWITTNKGLFKVARTDLLNYAMKSKMGQAADVFYLRYTKEQGFYTNEFNGGCQPCAIRLANKYVSLPSLDGLVWYIPEETRQELPTNKILLDRYELRGTRTFISNDTLNFPVDPQQIKIQLAMAYFGDLSNLDISYAILKNTNRSPIEADWLNLDGSETTISLGSLGTGNYSLYIKKINGFGAENYSIKKITIIVPPSWYETIWFKLVCLLLVILGIYIFLKIRLRIIKKENQLLELKIARRTRKLEHTLGALEKSEQELQRQMHIQTRLIASMSHDIKTPLKFVSKSAGRIDLMVKNERFESVSELGKTIEFTADHMHHLLENLIGYVKTQVYGSNILLEETNLKHSLSENLEIFKGVLNEHSNKFINEVDGSITVNTSPQLLGIIVHNLVDNANKFCQGGFIKMHTEKRQDYTHLIISDSGPGMPDEILQWLNNESKSDSYEKSKVLSKSYGGLGLTIVKEICMMLGIRILVENENGTLIHLIFPEEK
ncbi:ATP-binding protein [Dyadobacter sp. CY345]|uniref:sensor histidine kinase n=1 Tax=Dyadobacter sp. CY345 TaxID=2909335 RepID=UPI001F1D78A0|nr:HAMP domain-containing sensor histidine kinase [Dyadobacter sp. CY345]MCF2442809.1 ATP-binding protein [Dyadobacter sp. CY345]